MTNFLKHFPDYMPHEHGQIYVNTSNKTIFSQTYITEHTYEEIQEAHLNSNSAEWQFFFNTAPTDNEKQFFLELLGVK